MSETKFTPGPWRWELCLKSKRVQLCGGKPRFDLTVMDFVRWGMGGAKPRFIVKWDTGMQILEDGEKFGKPVPGREHHSDWFQAIDHPDAHLMAAAPDLYAALADFLDGDGEPHDKVITARAALAKARGETRG